MVVYGRRLWVFLMISLFSSAAFSFSVSNSRPDLFSNIPNSSDLTASTMHDRFSLKTDLKDIPVEVRMESDPCEQVTCMDIYPEDGKIEGKPVLQMTPSGINGRGQVVGRCTLEDSNNPFAFVREPDGNIWIFRPPLSSGGGEFTDINETGDAVGFYERDSRKAEIGFLMNSDRQWVADIEYPENPCPAGKAFLHTQPNGINAGGEIVGNYACTANPQDAADTLFMGDGFYRSPDGKYYRVRYENAVRTVAGKISDAGVIVGYYVLENDVWIPFAAVKEDVLHPIDRSQSSVR